MKNKVLTLTAMLVMSWACASGLQAQTILPSRTFVASTGSDTNNCSRTAPCATFSGAASKTFERGEITALDSGSYGNITITKSLTIQGAPGVQAAMGTTSSTTPVTVSAGVDDVVVLRNLYISRAGWSSATTGINYNSGGALHVEGCVVTGFTNSGSYGIRADPNLNPGGTLPQLFVKDTLARNNGSGMKLTNVFASIDHCRIENNVSGLITSASARVTLRDCLLAGNSDYGLDAEFDAYTNVENCVLANNGTGIYSHALDSYFVPTVSVSHTMISGNNQGLAGNGWIRSFGNNRLSNNLSNRAFTETLQEQ